MKRKGIPILIMALLLGFLLVVQTRTVAGQHVYVSPKALTDYKTSIEGETQDLENLKARLEETQAKLQEYQTLEAETGPLQEELEKQLREDTFLYGGDIGAVPLQGPGVEVFIDDEVRDLAIWENPNDVLVHDEDLLVVINELKAAGAEAISVNGQRLVGNTSVTCAGHTVRINGQFFARPFEIKAIGDGARMSAALIGPGCPGTILMDYVIFKVTVMDDILIPAYTEGYDYKYASPITAGEREKGTKQ